MFNKNRLRKYTIIGDKQLKKKERGRFEQSSTNQAKTKDSRAFYVAASKSCEPDRNLFSVRIKLKKVYSRASTKSISLLQPKHGFCQKNISERDQTQDWYPNCSSGCLGIALH